MAEVFDQFIDRGFAPIRSWHVWNRSFAVRSTIDNAPNSAALPVSSWMSERDLVMPDDAVVKIRHIECAVRTQFDVHRAKPGIVARQEIRLFDRLGRRTVPFQSVVIDAIGDDV